MAAEKIGKLPEPDGTTRSVAGANYRQASGRRGALNNAIADGQSADFKQVGYHCWSD